MTLKIYNTLTKDDMKDILFDHIKDCIYDNVYFYYTFPGDDDY